LADFDAGAASVLGMSCDDYQELHGAALMWKKLAEAPEFYARLPWMLGGKTLWRELNESTTWSGPKPMILTGLPLGDWAAPQKRQWVAEKLGGGIAVLTCMSRDKHTFCCAGDILIDDRESARLDWETAGGRFILHTTATASLAALAEIIAEPAAAE
jgi:hypothetical protein